MTNKEKQDILVAAIDRAYTVISETAGKEIQDQAFGDLLFHIERMGSLAADLNEAEVDCQDAKGETGEPNSFPGHPDAGTTKKCLEVPSETPAPEPEENEKPELEKEPEKPCSEKPEEVYKDWQVRAALANLRTKTGASPKEILASFGFNGFTSVPADKYPEIMKAVKEQERAHAS